MAVPKRRTSKSKRNKRRSHDALKPPSFGTCPRCGARTVPHRACPACGHYRDRQVIAVTEE
ncbi:MAG: 50S ribosomal protein L32 [Candidatus Dadabacteria bacterium]|nr:MAG: 50S ribosomal protein L32 [Candidatus Dadabacteria bacterium]